MTCVAVQALKNWATQNVAQRLIQTLLMTQVLLAHSRAQNVNINDTGMDILLVWLPSW